MTTLPNEFVATIVREVVPLTDRVTVFKLAQPEGWDLPYFSAGAHIDVHIPGGPIRQYSLFGDPDDKQTYAIAVLSKPDGVGSLAMRNVHEGDWLSVSLPKNYFPLSEEARHHIFIAGGIGITPFLSMMAAISRSGGSFELHMCGQTPADMPFFERLKETNQARLYFSRGDAPGRLDVQNVLSNRGPGEHVYCCGPDRLMNAVRDATINWDDAGRVHFERFVPAAPAGLSGLSSYRLKLRRNGREIEVAAGETMLKALTRNGVEVEFGCEGGTCGRCRTKYLAGDIDHRDYVLTGREREKYLMPCVSGALSEVVTLDL